MMDWLNDIMMNIGKISGSVMGLGIIAYFAKRVVEIPKEYVTKTDFKVLDKKVDEIKDTVSYIKGKLDA